jgi:hypothetical protein
MADFYFFTDIDKLGIQTSSEAYGPLPGSAAADTFRTTSLHTASSSPKAYAVCGGLVLAQATPDNNLINLILKPAVAFRSRWGPIDYIIYKGIIKTDIFSGNEIALNTNDLTKSIHQSQQQYNKKYDEANNNPAGTTTDKPAKEILGIHLDHNVLPDNATINTFFLKNDPYTIPVVQAGWHIGTFGNQKFGIEIISERFGFEARLEVSRNLEHIITVAKNTNASTYSDIYAERYKKEYALIFTDPCAFFGDFFSKGIQVIDSSGQKGLRRKNNLYNDLIFKFFNKNITYIDIRDERNFSFNFYGNYGNNIRINFGQGQQPTDYYRESWPLLRIQNAELRQGNTQEKNIIKIALPVGDNSAPKLYLEKARKNSGRSTSPLKDFAKNEDAFVELAPDDADTSFTREVALTIPNVIGGTGTVAPANYVKLKYCKGFETGKYPQSHVPAKHLFLNNHYLDNLFQPFRFSNPWGVNNPAGEIYVEVHEDNMFCSDSFHLYYDFVASTGKATDNFNVTFFACIGEKSRIDSGVRNKSFVLTTAKVTGYSDFLQYVSAYENDISNYRRSTVKVSGQSASVISLENTDLDSYNNAEKVNYDDFIFLTISKTEFAALENLKNGAGFHADSPVYLSLHVKSQGYDDSKVYFETYNLGLRGLALINGDLQIKEVYSTVDLTFYGG